MADNHEARLTQPAGGVIDITGVYPAPPIALSVLRGSALFLGGLVFTLIWVLVWIKPVANADMGPPLIFFGLVAAGPFLYAFYWLLSRSARWNSGVSTFLSAGQFRPEERSRPIPGMGITAGEVLASVERFAVGLGKPMVVRATGTKALQARGLQAGGVAVLLASIFLAARGGIGGFAMIFGLAVMTAAFARAGKMLQPSLDTLLAADRRKPILLLRAFKDDDARASQAFATPIGKILLARRFEQGIAGGLSTFGPLIAVGQPGEELPAVGAARTYLSDKEWQPAVTRWIDQALFILMVAGATRGITWELQRIVAQDRQHHLFIMLPPGNNQARWQTMVGSLAGTQWHERLAGLDFSGLILVWLRPTGGVTAVRRRGTPIIQDYELALAIAVNEEFCRDTGATKAA